MEDLPKSYEAKQVDAKWYQFWEGHHFFKSNPLSSKPAYCIVMPPPNVTGVLHMGHALVSTLQDILIRWKRMQGFEVLWVPGTDHAGISTQTVVERHLIRTEGKRRKDYSREEFLAHVWAWKQSSESRIIQQLKRLGSSCDWTRLRFTMDEGNNQAVRTIFKKLFDAGLIYRGNRLVNWDPVTQTVLADDEVESEERASSLWHIKYPVADTEDYIVIATTRPETMLGDTAVAIAPNDPRYEKFKGKRLRLPLSDRLIPIIEDHHVDPSFGTGALKVTPAHDPNDYEMGRVHGLDSINIMTPDGKINENGGVFTGLSMSDARVAVVKELQAQGLIVKIEPHTHRVGVSYRSKATIEPYLSKQWFVRMETFASHLKAAIKSEKTALIPARWENTFFHWIDNLRDWCISRQLWWGHRIPIWYNINDPDQVICHDGVDLPEVVKKNPEEWTQENDVLDTWFSSALWPFSTLGWPEQTLELKKFYPNSILVTGHDILFFWVARMMAMGEFAMGELPFPKVFLHGLIYGKSYWRENPENGIQYISEEERKEYDLGKALPKDVFSKWEKMSKSKGNIIDPLEMIDQYGTDAVRMALCASATHSSQIDLDRRRFEEFKNFANKIWNGARFVLTNLDANEILRTPALTGESFSHGLDESLLALEDRWILSMLNKTIQKVNHHLEMYAFDQAALEAYDFFWKEFCAYYLEIAKPVLFGKKGDTLERINKQKLLSIILCSSIRLMHPMAPFITEELFYLLKERLRGLNGENSADPYTKECIEALLCPSCIVAPYSKVIEAFNLNDQTLETFAILEQVVYVLRNMRGEMKLPPGITTDVYLIAPVDDPVRLAIEENLHVLSALVRIGKIEVSSHEPVLSYASNGMCSSLKIMIPLPKELLEQEFARLNKEKEKVTSSLEKINLQLSNQEFVSRAPQQLIEKLKKQQTDSERELQEILIKLEK